MRERTIPGVDLAIDFTPWVMFPEAAALSAHVRHGVREPVVGAARLPGGQGDHPDR